MTFGSKVLAWEVSDEPFGPNANMVRRAAIESLGQDSSVTFQDGLMAENVDAVVFATGYQFAFPFLDKSKAINVQDNRHAFARPSSVATPHSDAPTMALPSHVILPCSNNSTHAQSHADMSRCFPLVGAEPGMNNRALPQQASDTFCLPLYTVSVIQTMSFKR